MNKTILFKLLLGLSCVALVVTIIILVTGQITLAGGPLLVCFVTLALYTRGYERWQGHTFTIWVFTFLAAAMFFPWWFTGWGHDPEKNTWAFNTKVLVLPLLQLIMFGMGTKLNLSDFVRELKKPKGILVGIILVFSIMPLAGYILAKTLPFNDAELGLGVILIGSCPGGMASNVMTFLANGNLALSVSITTGATLLSPIITPVLVKFYGGQLVHVPLLSMFLRIIMMIVLPITAGVVVNWVHHIERKRSKFQILGLFIVALVCLGFFVPDFRVGILGISFFAVITALMSKALLDRMLPMLSMGAILLFVTIVVAHYRDDLLEAGLSLILSAIIHNAIGYGLGYWISRSLRFSERDCRTLAIEVGLKNGGMGTLLAMNVLESPKASLAPVIFGKWMNISGSALANYWRQRPVEEDT